MEGKPCIFCYRISSNFSNTDVECQNSTSNVNDKSILNRFIYLLGRHLDEGRFSGDDDGRSGENIRLQFEKLISAGGISSCVDCSKIMESFCQLYHQMKSIELMLDWKVRTLNNIMLAAQRLPSRMHLFRERMAQMNTVGDITEDIMDLKECLITECTRKLTSSLPRLEIRKCDSAELPQAFHPISIKAEILNSPDMTHESVEDDYLYCMETSYERADNVDPLTPSPHLMSSSRLNSPPENDRDRPRNDKQIIHVTVIQTPSSSETKPTVTAMKPVKEVRSTVKIENNFDELNHQTTTEDVHQQDDSEEQDHRPELRHNDYFIDNLNTGLFPCQFCGENFRNWADQISHEQKVHHTRPPKLVTQHKCEFCSEIFTSLTAVSRHKYDCHVLNQGKRIIRYECEICHEKFRSVSVRTKHQYEAHNGQKYACDFCYQTFVIRAYKYVHKQTCPERPLPNPDHVAS